MSSTENITALFTDLVGSTQLAASLTPHEADEVRRAHFDALRQAVVATGGTEVKNLGDGLMVVFSTASAALTCAVAMQQAIEEGNRTSSRSLGLRVGVSAGEATREADDYFGDPVIEAARLCAKAEGGQILVADLVRAMAGRRVSHEFLSVGALELKGLPDPVETLEVRWEPILASGGAATSVPFPSRLDIRPQIGVIGRGREAALLADAFKRVASGAGSEVVLVSGEPGLGKTTLVAESAASFAADRGIVLLGRCQEDLSVSYAPFVEALQHYVVHAPDDVLQEHISAHGGELGRIISSLERRLGSLPPSSSSDPDTERYLLYGAAVGLLTAASASNPVVLVLDDLQWADKPSLQLLRHLVANLDAANVLVLGTFRDAELSGSHPLTALLGLLRRESMVSRIELRGFGDTEVVEFMSAVAGHELDERSLELAQALQRETDGNPFFVGEVLRSLIETDAIVQDRDGRWAPAGELSAINLPTSIREVISARVARLGDRAGELLAMAAVVGRDFDFDLLNRVGGTDPHELLDVLDAAASAALVREVASVQGRWSFSHALTQHTLYQDLGATRRSLIHRQVAEALEVQLGPDPGARAGELAFHWRNATQPINADKAIRYARQAAEVAMAALAPDDAVRYYSEALELFEASSSPDAGLRCDLLIGLGASERQAGLASSRRTLLDAAATAIELGDTERLVDAAITNSRGITSRIWAVDKEKVDVLTAALAALPSSDSAERAHLLALLCGEFTYDTLLERRQALADEALAMARRIGDPSTTVRVICDIDGSIDVPSRLADRRANSLDALALAEQIGDPELLQRAASVTRVSAIQAGDFELAARCGLVVAELADRVQRPSLRWLNACQRCGNALLAGDISLGKESARAAYEYGLSIGEPDATDFYGVQLSVIRLQEGRLGEMAELMDRRADMIWFRPSIASGHLEIGDPDRALWWLLDAAADDFASMPYDQLWLYGISEYASVAAALREKVVCRSLFEKLAPFHDQVVFNGMAMRFPVAYHLGALTSVLGRFEEAETYFAEAADLNQRGDMAYSSAMTDLAWGEMVATRDADTDRGRAQDLLSSSLTIALDHGYAAVERQARAALASCS